MLIAVSFLVACTTQDLTPFDDDFDVDFEHGLDNGIDETESS